MRLRNNWDKFPLPGDVNKAIEVIYNIAALAEGNSFFSSYHPKTRRPPVDGVTSSSGLPVGERKSQVYTHAEFMETYADVQATRLRSGENPLLDTYKNVKFLF